MGHGQSTVLHTVTAEYHRMHDLRVRHRRTEGYLTLNDVLRMKLDFGVEINHIGVIYVLDRNLDGQITLEELHHFASWAYRQSRSFQARDAGFLVQGCCSLQLWRGLRDPGGRQRFADWAVKVFTVDRRTCCFSTAPSPFVERKALEAVHGLFDLQRSQGLDVDAFTALMQSAAEEQGLTDPTDEAQDAWVPVESLRLFCEAMFDGMCSVMEGWFEAQELEGVLEEGPHHAPVAGSGSGGGLGGITAVQEEAEPLAAH